MNVTTYQFDQKVDHYDPSNYGTFKQTYLIVEDYYKKLGPLLIYICGISPNIFPIEGSLFSNLMKSYNAIGVSLEHRYIGSSQPTTDWRLTNMQYLSHDQAIADIAYFIKGIKNSIFKKYGITEIKTVVVGGSYAGALSAWARYKYPHLIDAAISSSGVFNAIEDFYMFDEQMYISTLKSGVACPAKIQQLIAEVANRMEQGVVAKYKLMSMFKAEFMEWDDFWFYFTDIFVEIVMHGKRTNMCTFLSSLNGSMDDQLQLLANYAGANQIDATDYAFMYLRKEEINITNLWKQWTFLFCSSLGFFNTPGRQNSLRWKGMDLYYWRRYCFKSFGDVVMPDAFNVNAIYGGVKIATAGSHIYFTNSIEDPWQCAGLRNGDAISGNNKAAMIDCDDCSHCKDLQPSNANDPQIVTTIREDIKMTIEGWLKETSAIDAPIE